MSTAITIRKNSRARRISITVRGDGSVLVTQPKHASRFAVSLFILSRRAWITEKIAYFSSRPKLHVLPTGRRSYLEHKEAARTLVCERLAHFNTFYGHEYRSVSIKNLSSRWGSCSSRKNLNFNYKILFLTKEQQDYVVVHELCHLKEMNHSQKFWALVEQQAPDYKKIRNSIRRFQL